MSGQIARRLKPEEEEILRKREELAAIRATLAERELELIDLRSQLPLLRVATYGRWAPSTRNWTNGKRESRSYTRGLILPAPRKIGRAHV